MDISKRYDEIARCNRCGFCQVACPIFRATGQENGVARGRVATLRALVEKRLEWSPEIEESLFACLLCGACTANCFPALPTADLITAARGEYLEKVGIRRLQRLLFDHLLPYPKRLRIAARAAALGKNSGASKVAKTLGLLRLLGHNLEKIEGIVDHVPVSALREKYKPGVEMKGQGEKLRVGYFVGCGTDIMAPVAGEISLQILLSLCKSVTVLNNCCCGLPPETYGEHKAARKLASKNLDLLDPSKYDAIVTDCSSCASFLKKYPTLFPKGDPCQEAAKALAGKVRDFLEMAAPGTKTISGDKPLIVTYHDPCHASRGQGLTAAPRKILRSLSNVEYRELPEADWCCGGAGSYALSHYELSRKVLERKMDNVEKTGAQILATSCPACMIQLSYGVRMRKLAVRVCHISEVIALSKPPLKD